MAKENASTIMGALSAWRNWFLSDTFYLPRPTHERRGTKHIPNVLLPTSYWLHTLNWYIIALFLGLTDPQPYTCQPADRQKYFNRILFFSEKLVMSIFFPISQREKYIILLKILENLQKLYNNDCSCYNVFSYVYVCMYVCMHAYIHTCTNTHTCIHTYIHTIDTYIHNLLT